MPGMGDICLLMTRCLQQQIAREFQSGWDYEFLVDDNALSELRFWKNNLTVMNGREIQEPPHSFVVYSDASSFAGGGYIEGLEDLQAHRLFTTDEVSKSRTFRELLAVQIVLVQLGERFLDSVVLWRLDNSSSRILSVGSMRPHLQQLALAIHNIARDKNLFIRPQWVKRGQNAHADFISNISDTDSWRVSKNVFRLFEQKWDRFPVICSRTLKMQSVKNLFQGKMSKVSRH